MPHIPNIFSLVSTLLILTGVCYLCLAVGTLKADPRSAARRGYFLAAFFLAMWSFGFGIMTVADNEPLARYAWMFGFIAFYLFPPAWFNFFTLLAAYDPKKVKYATAFLYALSVSLITLCLASGSVVFSFTEYGVQFSYQNALVFKLILVYMLVLVMAGPLLLTAVWRKSRLKRLQKQAATFIAMTLIVAPPALVFDFVVPSFTGFTIAPLSAVPVLIVSLYLYFTLRSNNAINITVYNVSEFLFRSVTMPVLILDYKNNVALANHAAVDFLAGSFGNVVGRNIKEIVTAEGKELSAPMLEENIGGLNITVPTGRGERVCEMLLTVVRDGNRDILSKIVVFKDITEMRNTLDELRLSKEAAERASRAKSEFLSRMSHEFRTPMNAILGMVNIGQGSEDLDKTKYCLRRIDDASKHLLGLINDVLDMSKIEADKFELIEEPFNLDKMLKNICNIMAFDAESKKLNLLVSIDPAVPLELLGDELRLSQVVTNLLSNAIKFSSSESGSVRLNVGMGNAGEGEAFDLHLEVIDHGIGMNEEQQAKLFTSFEQTESSIVRRFGGTGLGLAISKRIIELMGGEVRVVSKPGEGSRFSFFVRLKRAEGVGGQEPEDTDFCKDLKILVVDESQELREYFAKELSGFVGTVHCAGSAEEALELARAAKAAGEIYHVVFINYLLREPGGLASARKIKEILGGKAQTIIVSPPDRSVFESDAAAAGVAGFVQRPLFRSSIIRAMSEVMQTSAEAGRPDNAAPSDKEAQFCKCRLLLVEDIEINREIALALLEDTKLSVECAENGQEALDMFCADEDRYDLILMDLHMPVMDGLEATRRIRALGTARSAAVPIIALTANAFKDDVDACKAAGMNDHISKPIDVGELHGKISKYLSIA